MLLSYGNKILSPSQGVLLGTSYEPTPPAPGDRQFEPNHVIAYLWGNRPESHFASMTVMPNETVIFTLDMESAENTWWNQSAIVRVTWGDQESELLDFTLTGNDDRWENVTAQFTNGPQETTAYLSVPLQESVNISGDIYIRTAII